MRVYAFVLMIRTTYLHTKQAKRPAIVSSVEGRAEIEHVAALRVRTSTQGRVVADLKDNADTIQSVALALNVLEAVAAATQELGVTELATALQTTKSRVHRHLRSLVALGYVAQSERTERYRPGPRLIALGQTASGSTDLSSVARLHMRALRDRTGQAVSLGQVDQAGIQILQTLPGNMAIDVGVRPGSVLGFSNSAQGKAALAAMSKERMLARIPKKLQRTTRFTIANRKKLIAHLEDIRSAGWATAPNEMMLGLNALACAVRGADGEPVATIAIVSLTQFIDSPPLRDQIEAVCQAAARVSAELGFQP